MVVAEGANQGGQFPVCPFTGLRFLQLGNLGEGGFSRIQGFQELPIVADGLNKRSEFSFPPARLRFLQLGYGSDHRSKLLDICHRGAVGLDAILEG